MTITSINNANYANSSSKSLKMANTIPFKAEQSNSDEFQSQQHKKKKTRFAIGAFIVAAGLGVIFYRKNIAKLFKSGEEAVKTVEKNAEEVKDAASKSTGSSGITSSTTSSVSSSYSATTASSQAQQAEKSADEVKSVFKNEYSLKTGKVVKQSRYEENVLKNITEFDAKTGNITREIFFKEDGKKAHIIIDIDPTTNKPTSAFVFHENGKKNVEVFYEKNGNDFITNTYDESENLLTATSTKTVTTSQGAVCAEETDVKTGHMVRKTNISANKQLEKKVDYDLTTGKKAKVTDYSKDGSRIEQEMEYDTTTGLKTKTINYNEDGTKVVTSHDPKNEKITSMSHYSKNGVLTKVEEYDAASLNGEKVKTINYQADGKTPETVLDYNPKTGLKESSTVSNKDGSITKTFYGKGEKVIDEVNIKTTTSSQGAEYKEITDTRSGKLKQVLNTRPDKTLEKEINYDLQTETKKSVVNYNKDGKTVEQIMEYDTTTGLNTRTLNYNEDGGMTITEHQPKNELVSKISKFSKEGTLKEVQEFDNSIKVTGNPVKITHYKKDGKNISGISEHDVTTGKKTQEISFDEKGRIIEESSFENEELVSKTNHKYAYGRHEYKTIKKDGTIIDFSG